MLSHHQLISLACLVTRGEQLVFNSTRTNILNRSFQDLVNLKSIPNVVQVRPVSIVPPPECACLIRIKTVLEPNGYLSPVAKRVLSNSREPAPKGQSTHVMTVCSRFQLLVIMPRLSWGLCQQGVDKLHANGITGKGIKIAMYVIVLRKV